MALEGRELGRARWGSRARVQGAGGGRLAAGPGSGGRRPRRRSPLPEPRRLRPAARHSGSGGR